MTTPKGTYLRPDLTMIADMITPNSRVLDIGCDKGDLLNFLVKNKMVDGRGIELSQQGVNECVANGLFVIQGDADNDLGEYPDQSFDYVVLSRTLQAVKDPQKVLRELLRIGKKAIVTIPNFGQWRVRVNLFTSGRMPVTKSLDKTWYNTDNIHFCTILDLFDLIEQEGYVVETFIPYNKDGKRVVKARNYANFFADNALFLLNKEEY
ncbi:methionine biosynthesis protein MetW [Kordiimonas sp. SCSIO 12610]|uniref:methionine biosynthesis protein MetW n=1 Tax=Kordiimonas sp. SCSIO 12610 TaxID=2829597 RepID=UPI00210DA69E|nr:methionine biosynthesis protein MetW [Kordiimonas sp. SCSIO 12610]UTW55156.1 methionine biosynthesis protein MetW [Kordiimonas sp. SCSIO 12610]